MPIIVECVTPSSDIKSFLNLITFLGKISTARVTFFYGPRYFLHHRCFAQHVTVELGPIIAQRHEITRVLLSCHRLSTSRR